MDRRVLPVLAFAALAGSAHAQQALIEVFVEGQQFLDVDSTLGGQFEVSVWLDRNGSTEGFFSSFRGWSNFSGSLSIGGPDNLFQLPVEGVTPGETQADDWGGRRPPAFAVPGGAAGGFRFAPANTAFGIDQFGNRALVGIEGIQASAALGGFSQDTSDRVEVFRTTVELTGQDAASWEIGFIPTGLQVAITSDFNTQRAVFDEVEFRTAYVGTLLIGARYDLVVPTPASTVLLIAGLGAGFLIRRRA